MELYTYKDLVLCCRSLLWWLKGLYAAYYRASFLIKFLYKRYMALLHNPLTPAAQVFLYIVLYPNSKFHTKNAVSHRYSSLMVEICSLASKVKNNSCCGSSSFWTHPSSGIFPDTKFCDNVVSTKKLVRSVMRFQFWESEQKKKAAVGRLVPSHSTN